MMMGGRPVVGTDAPTGRQTGVCGVEVRL